MDLRKHIRFHVQFRSSFSSVSMVGGEGDIVDLSISGCRIESVVDVQPGASLEVRIVTNSQQTPILIQQAIVRWKRLQQFGLEFVTMDTGEWARLQHTVKQIEMEPYQRDDRAAKIDKSL
jgi:PilZ domain-containing protein